ncbi:hypothetical protein [Methylosinus sp. R-45379]|uniref:hypothetical protein n=1 Tax=Methylosinus sp. R-45379 TaxID=980563 RepID=UPI000AD4A267|nr:hypothetical protein [Methylosinus sp. R-45379]
MGWQGQHHRDLDDERQWRELPLRQRYDWWGVAVFVVGVVAVVVLIVNRIAGNFMR